MLGSMFTWALHFIVCTEGGASAKREALLGTVAWPACTFGLSFLTFTHSTYIPNYRTYCGDHCLRRAFLQHTQCRGSRKTWGVQTTVQGMEWSSFPMCHKVNPTGMENPSF